MVITRVAPVSVAKIAAIVYVVLGFIFGAFVSLATLLGSVGGGGGPLGRGLFGLGAIVVLPIVYACIGFVMTLIMAGLFNVATGIVGGVEVDVT
jgi:hypothetical protein